MMKLSNILAATLLVACSAPAGAADFTSMACILREVGQPAMRTLGEAALAMNDREAFSPPDRELDALARATDQCRVSNRWSAAAATTAGLWILTSARLDAVIEALQRDGVSPTDAGAVVGRLGAAERDGLIRDPISPVALNALKRYAIAAGIPTQGRPANHFVWFTILLIQEDSLRTRFSMQ
jgi:hypothetical protein